MRHQYLIVSLFFSLGLVAQQSGDNVFDNSFLHDVHFDVPGQNFLEALEQNFRPFDPFDPGPYTMANVVIDGERVDSVGVRLKGFTSFQGPGQKNPFKIDFNRFVPGKRLDGLRKVNLNNATADPGMQRDVICYQMLNDAGVPAPRTAFARVYINGSYWGLYQLIEQVDQEFLQINYANDDGNLFKNKDWNNFEYNGEDPDNYNSIYQLKTNEEENDWTGLINLMRTVSDTDDETFRNEIPRVFNVDRYLRTLAVDVATNNWDSNLQHGRNWYLYEDTQTGIFNWIPWDYNLAWDGQLSFGGGGDDCFTGAYFLALTTNTDTVEFYQDAFTTGDTLYYTWDFGDGTGSTEENPVHVYDSIGQYEVCLTVESDEEFCGDTECITVDLTENLLDCPSVESGEMQTANALVFLTMLNWAAPCCNEWGEDCQELQDDLFVWFGEEDGENGGEEDGSGFAIDQRGTDRVLIERLLAIPEYYERYRSHFCTMMAENFTPERYNALVDNNRALIMDAAEQDPNFLYDFEDFLEDTGANGIKAKMTARAEYLVNELADTGGCPEPQVIAVSDVVINEFMAINDSLSGIRDQAGETDDWLELYNNTDQEQDLSDVYLSDNPENKFKWQFPAGTVIPADGYLIVWCDEDGGQEGLHASFRLNGAGEELFLTNGDGSEIDAVVFGEQDNNVSLSRVPNGTGDFVAQHTTLKYSNDTPSATPDLGAAVTLEVFPNPVGESLNVRVRGTSRRLTVDLVSGLGQVLRRGVPLNGNGLDVSGLAPGLYLVIVRDDAGRARTVRVVKG